MVPCSPATGSSRSVVDDSDFAFHSAQVHVGDKRFELSMWDWQFSIMLLLPASCDVLVWIFSWHLAVVILAALILLSFTARTVLMVTRHGSWLVQRICGVEWQRKPLGMKPKVLFDRCWDWNEIAVKPSEDGLRKGLHDDERAVLAEWCDVSTEAAKKDLEAFRLVDLATAEIARLHAQS